MKYLQGSSGHVFLLIIVSSLLYLPFLGTPDLVVNNELCSAQVARETLEDGHWLMPHLHGEPFFNKPPVFFWAVALSSKVTGSVTEMTARLPSALGAMGTVLITYFLGRSFLGSRAGLLAALILACSPKFYLYARTVRLDPLYTFFFTSAMASFYYGYTYKQRTYLLLAGLAIALATLTKGPLSLYFLGTVIFLYLVYCRDIKFLFHRDCLLGVFVLLLTILAWAVPACVVGGSDYVDGFIAENFGRFASKGTEWDVPLEYLGDVFIGAAPWSFFLPLVLYSYFSKGESNKETVFLLIWVAVVALSFCLTFQRRSTYLLPLYPALSIVVAGYFESYLGEETTRRSGISFAVSYLLAAAVGLLIAKVANTPAEELSEMLIAAIMLATCIVAVVFLNIRSKSLYTLLVCVVISMSVCAFSQSVYFVHRVEQPRSHKALCEEISGLLKDKDDIVLEIYRHPELLSAFSFYVDRDIKTIDTIYDLEEYLASSEEAYCVMTLKDYHTLIKRDPAIDNPSLSELSQSGIKYGYFTALYCVDMSTISKAWHDSDTNSSYYIQLSLRKAKAYARCKIWLLGSPSTASAWKIQYSSDGVSWSDATGTWAMDTRNGYNTITWSNTTPYSYWRLASVDSKGSNWYTQMRWYAETSPLLVKELKSGNTDYVLVTRD